MNLSVVSEIAQFNKLEDAWNTLFSRSDFKSFYLSFEWFKKLIVDPSTDDLKLHCVLVTDNGMTVAIVPFCYSRSQRRKIPLLTLQFLGNHYSSLCGGLVLPAYLERAATCIAEYLLSRNVSWEMLHFSRVDSQDQFSNQILREMSSRGVGFIREMQNEHFAIDLTPFADSESHFRALGKSTRRNTRVFLREFLKKHEACLYLAKGVPSDEAIRDHFALFERSKRGEEQIPYFQNYLLRSYSQSGNLRLMTLYARADGSTHVQNDANDVPRVPLSLQYPSGLTPYATLLVLIDTSTAYMLRTAFDQRYASYSPGFIVMWEAIRYLKSAEAIDTIDFQRGGEQYKQWFGATRRGVRNTFKALRPKTFKSWSIRVLGGWRSELNLVGL